MKRVKVDQTGFEYIRFIASEPRMKYENGQRVDEQERDGNGTPLYTITCLAKVAGTVKPETITVKVPMTAEPNIDEFAKVAFANLSAYAYASKGDRAQLSFSADKIGKARE